MIYKVSYVVLGGKHPGAIKSQEERPEPGSRVRLGRKWFEVVEVSEVMPPREDFAFLHATLREAAKTADSG
ncbi:MAG: hypothetical protein U0670_11865 [Anaerolineae bacterium]